jgi:hypothetical protein
MENRDIELKKHAWKRCPECGKKVKTILNPLEHRGAELRIECNCNAQSKGCYIYLTYWSKKRINKQKSKE